jgi:very-short-patch-repair endonuclease
VNRDAAPSPPAGEGWGEGSLDAAGAAPLETRTGNDSATPHPAAARPPSPAGGEGAPAPTRREVLKTRARAMRREPTESERKLWHLLRDRRFSGFKFRRQVQIGSYIVDFVCPAKRLVVEADGGQHAENRYDAQRDIWLKTQGFRIPRFWNDEILHHPDEVSDTLWNDLDGTTIHEVNVLKEHQEQ